MQFISQCATCCNRERNSIQICNLFQWMQITWKNSFFSELILVLFRKRQMEFPLVSIEISYLLIWRTSPDSRQNTDIRITLDFDFCLFVCILLLQSKYSVLFTRMPNIRLIFGPFEVVFSFRNYVCCIRLFLWQAFRPYRTGHAHTDADRGKQILRVFSSSNIPVFLF